jgi:hypothetical protein
LTTTPFTPSRHPITLALFLLASWRFTKTVAKGSWVKVVFDVCGSVETLSLSRPLTSSPPSVPASSRRRGRPASLKRCARDRRRHQARLASEELHLQPSAYSTLSSPPPPSSLPTSIPPTSPPYSTLSSSPPPSSLPTSIPLTSPPYSTLSSPPPPLSLPPSSTPGPSTQGLAGSYAMSAKNITTKRLFTSAGSVF